jgi:hypothetical protein
MKTFYLISYASKSGAIKKSIEAKDENEAHFLLQSKGFDTRDDNYIIESKEYETLRGQFIRL